MLFLALVEEGPLCNESSPAAGNRQERRTGRQGGGNHLELSNNGRRMLKAMREEPSKTWNLTDLLSACDWTDQAHVAGAGAALSEAGLVSQTEARTTLSLIHI